MRVFETVYLAEKAVSLASFESKPATKLAETKKRLLQIHSSAE
jgi:hypothetical protein